MKTLVVYKSTTGHTQKYAQWIGEELQCDIKDIENMKKSDWQNYDLVIFGSHLMAGKIKELHKVKSMVKQKLIVFSTGLAPAVYAAEKVKNDNFSPSEQTQIPFYYFEGGINYEKLGFFSSKMLKMIGSSLKKKEDKTEEDLEMIKKFDCTGDYTNINYIQPLIEKVKTEFQ